MDPGPNGSPVNIVDKRGTNEFHGNAFFRLGNRRYGNEFISYAGASGVPGLGQWNLRIPEDAPEGCDVPIQLEYQRNGGPVIRGNQVRIPISRSGTCSDALGFNATEVSQFPRTTMEALVSENTFLGASRRDVIQSSLTATTWTDSTYVAPPPVNTWGYRWEPFNYTNPFAPSRAQLGGTSTLTLPWGAFSYSPASNNGPYSLLFSFPSLTGASHEARTGDHRRRTAKPPNRIRSAASAAQPETHRRERRTNHKSRATTPGHRDSESTGDERSRKLRARRGQPPPATDSS